MLLVGGTDMNTRKGIPLAVVIAQAIRNERALVDDSLLLLTERVEDLEETVGELEEKEGDALFTIPIATPVNAVAASCVLTVGDTPEEGDTVTVGLKTYRARLDTLGTGVAASQNLYLNSNPLEGDTITIGGVVYKFRVDALGAGVAASAVLTNDETAPSDGDTVTIGTTVYRFKDSPDTANDIGISTAAVSMTRLFKAINGTGIEGSDYFAGTSTPDVAVTAVNTSDFVVTVTADSVGFAGNLFAKAESSAHLDWDGETGYFTGGIDAQAANDVYRGGGTSACIDNLVIAINTGASEGVVGTGTVAHTLVMATKVDTQNINIEAETVGADGNLISLAESLDDADSIWFGEATFLSGGVDPEEANDVYCTTAETFINNLVKAINHSGTEGTDWGTGTLVNADCTASKLSASTMKATSRTLGVIGNDIAIAEDGTDLSWADDATELSGGVDGTPGEEGQAFYEGGTLWICNKDDDSTENNNWLSTTLT